MPCTSCAGFTRWESEVSEGRFGILQAYMMARCHQYDPVHPEIDNSICRCGAARNFCERWAKEQTEEKLDDLRWAVIVAVLFVLIVVLSWL